MKFFLVIFLFCLLVGCSSGKTVYWCGDHACKNKKEKEAYFKEHMTVEIRNINYKKKENKTNLDIIKENTSLKSKKQIKEDLKLKKKARLDEKKRIKEEKKLAKKTKKLKVKKKVSDNVIKIDTETKFSNLVRKIKENNMSKPFPDINRVNHE